MKKKQGLFLFLMAIIYCLFNNLLPKQLVLGVYQNVNFENSPIHPRMPDTLWLLENYEFYSKQLGYGTYKIFYDFNGTKIRFWGTENSTKLMERTWAGRPQIIMFSDLKHAYVRIKATMELSAEQIAMIRRSTEKRKKQTEMLLRKIQKEVYGDSIKFKYN